MEALSDRQMSALRVRAHFVGPATGQLRQGVRDASQWLADRLQDHPQHGERFELRKVLREYATNQIQWDVSEYEDGHAAVLDDVLAILNSDPNALDCWAAEPHDAVPSTVETAQAAAKARGHDVEPDPPFMSAAGRWTCRICGRAVIANGPVIYGSATVEDCTAKGAHDA